MTLNVKDDAHAAGLEDAHSTSSTFRIAHADFIQLPAPDHVLINDEAQKRLGTHGIVCGGRYAPNGASFGFGTNGAQALQELAALLWKETSAYHLGTEAGRFLRAVVDAVTTDFRTRGRPRAWIFKGPGSEEKRFELKPRLSINDPLLIHRQVVAGIGLGCLSGYQASRWPRCAVPSSTSRTTA